MKIFIAIFLLAISHQLFAQSPTHLDSATYNMEEQLAYYADIMRNTIDSKHRVRANGKFYNLFKMKLSKGVMNTKSIENLSKYISVISPVDKTFQIFSWQLDLDNTFYYHCFIQMNDGKIIELHDHAPELLTSSYEVLDSDNWYGALYYNIKVFKKGRKDYYLLFGYNSKNQYSNQKIIEVLSFNNEEVVFGAPVFVMNDERRPDERYRYIIEYEENATARLNYDKNLEKIVFDHLIPFGAYIDENTEAMVPDGSYSSFELKKGKWIYNEKLFHHKSDTPPGKGKSTSSDKKDVFGRDR